MSTNHSIFRLSFSCLVLGAACSSDSLPAGPPTSGDPAEPSGGGETTTEPGTTGENPSPESTGGGDPSDPSDPSDTTSVADSSGGDSESSTTFPYFMCEPSTHECVAPVPTGWNGPVLLAEGAGDADSGCAGDYATTERTGFRGLEASPPKCSCSCSSPNGDVCDDDTTAHYYPFNWPVVGSNVASCTNLFSSIDIVALTAFDAIVPSRWRADPVEPVGGSCNPSAVVDIEPATFTDRIDACAPTTPVAGACEDGGACVPIPERDAPMCIWIEGEEDCPAEYPQQSFMHGGIEDSRACGSCGCGGPQGGSCDDSIVYLWTGLTPHPIPADGFCYFFTDGSNGAITAVNFDPGSVSGGSCTPSGGAPLGDVEATDVTTVCCDAGAD